MAFQFHCGQEIYSGLRTGTQEMNLSSSRPAWEASPGYSVAPWVTSEEEQKSEKALMVSNWRQSGMPSVPSLIEWRPVLRHLWRV